METSQFNTFLVAATLLAIMPGPGVMFVLAQTVKGGKNSGLSASFGTGVGGILHVFFATLGISAILYTSALAFEAVKTAGVVYLIYLGLKALRDKNFKFETPTKAAKFEQQSFQQGIITEALNPKTALFFLAFIPQFVNSQENIALQFIFLGLISVCLNTLVDVLVVLFSNSLLNIFNWSNATSKILKYTSSSTYFGLAFLAWRTQRD